jgi:hypothetical protein
MRGSVREGDRLIMALADRAGVDLTPINGPDMSRCAGVKR